MLYTLSRVTEQLLEVLVPGGELKISTDRMTVFTVKDAADLLLAKEFVDGKTEVVMPKYCDLVPSDACTGNEVVALSVRRDAKFDNLLRYYVLAIN